MAGLLDGLGSLLSGSGIADQVAQQAGLLTALIDQQGSLGDGPAALTEVEGLLAGGGAPSFDPGPLAGLGSGVASLSLPTDLTGPLAPILEPLQGLVGLQAGFGAAVGTLDLLRRVIELAFRRSFSAAPLPHGLGAHGRWGLPGNDLSLDDARQSLQEAIDLLGDQPALDAERLVALARRVGGAYDIHTKWPRIPALSEAAEALQTVARWEGSAAAQLTPELARSASLAAQVIALPRTRVALPVIEAGQRAASLPTALRAAVTTLLPLLDGLRRASQPGAPSPGSHTLDVVDAALAPLESAVRALDLDRGPLGRLAALPAELELSLLRSIRALTPSGDAAALLGGVQAAVDEVPAADAAVFTDVLQSIEDLDLTGLTDPLTRVRDAVQEAVDAVEAAKDGVRQALVDLLQPVDDALAALISAAGLDTLPQTLQDLADQLETFVQDEIIGRLTPIQEGVTALVDGLADAVDQFDPEQLIAPIRDALDELAGLLAGEEVMSAIATVEGALADAVAAIEQFTLAPAADVVIENIGGIEAKVAEIDLSSVPDAALPLLQQAVDGLVSINISASVEGPIVDGLRGAIQDGPGAAVGAIRGAADQLRAAVEGFKPSEIVGDTLQRPFDELLTTLRSFRPSALLDRLQAALTALVGSVTTDGLAALLQPLDDAHAAAAEAIASLRPSNLLRPVEEAIEAAVADVLRSSGVEGVLDGLVGTIADINAWLDVAADARDALHHVARVLETPADAEAALQQLVDDALDRLGEADVAAMQPGLTAAREAQAAIRAEVLHAELAVAVRAAVDAVPPALTGDDARRLKEAARGWPLAALRALPAAERRARLVRQVERLLAVADALDAAAGPWSSAGRLRDEVAGMPPRLETYVRVFRYEGNDIFATFTRPVTSAAELQTLVRPVLERDLRPVLRLAFAALHRLGPHIAVVARGLGDVLVAVQTKISAFTGDEGLGGIVGGVDEIADMLRDLDLTPITDPLDTIWGRIEGAWGALDPDNLRPVLQAFSDSVAAVLDLGNLIDPAASAQLDATFLQLVDDLEALSPERLVAATLDPAYARAMEPVRRVLELPDRLQELIDTVAEHVPDDAVVQIGRVEVAFDAMIRALPLGGPGASASASVSIG